MNTPYDILEWTPKRIKNFVRVEMERKKLSHADVKTKIIQQDGYYPGLSVWLQKDRHGILLNNLLAVLNALRAL